MEGQLQESIGTSRGGHRMNPKCLKCDVEIDKQNCSEWVKVYRKSEYGNIYDVHYLCDIICFMDWIEDKDEDNKLLTQTSDGFETKAEDLRDDTKGRYAS